MRGPPRCDIGPGSALLAISAKALCSEGLRLTVACSRCDREGLWLGVEAAFSARFGVWFNVGVDAGVLALFSVPLIASMRAANTAREGKS